MDKQVKKKALFAIFDAWTEILNVLFKVSPDYRDWFALMLMKL